MGKTREVVKKAQQRLQTVDSGLQQKLLANLYQSPIESVLSYGCTVGMPSYTSEERKDLKRITETTSKITGARLPSLEQIHSAWLRISVDKIRSDP